MGNIYFLNEKMDGGIELKTGKYEKEQVVGWQWGEGRLFVFRDGKRKNQTEKEEERKKRKNTWSDVVWEQLKKKIWLN
jgi:hypothetical protein